MNYFPAFIKLEHTKILIVGGGKIATEKMGHMLDFTDNITVISPKLSSQMRDYIIKSKALYLEKYYHEGDVDGFDIVIIAVDDI